MQKLTEREPWQDVRCDFTVSGICASRIADACICQGWAYRRLKADEEARPAALLDTLAEAKR